MGSGVSTAKPPNTNPTSARKNTCKTEVGSAETYEHTCDVCKDQEKEAVQLCKQCQQHLCLQCSKSHTHSNQNKSSSNETIDSRSLFAKQLVPVSYASIRDKYDVGKNKENKVLCLVMSPTSGEILALINDHNRMSYLTTVNGHGSVMKETCIGRDFIMFIRDPRSKTDILLTAMRNAVHTFDISKTSRPDDLFRTSAYCYGIAEFDKGFAVSMRLEAGYSLPNWQIQYLDSKGKIKKQIFYDSDNKPLFSCPMYLLSNKARNILYVSDVHKHAIIALNTDGNVLFTYSHNDMKTPRAMAIDDEGNLYVACGDNLVQIHKSGTKHRVLLQRSGNQPEILSVCFNPTSRALIVGEASETLKTFSFHP